MPSAAPLLDCFAAVAPGLEPYALAEARALGIDASPTDGGITWTGDAYSVLMANAGLRIASRVLVRLATFDAKSFAELERHARRIPWSRVIRSGDSVRFRVTCKKSKLYHSDAVAQRLADALKRAIPNVNAEGSSIGDEDTDVAQESTLIVVRFMRDRCTVSADSSGELLHRRGYRQATAKAPLRETIAAAMLAASEWDCASPLVDPLCGAGTIPIEAALLAGGIAPGANRAFAIEKWPGISITLGERVRATLAERRSSNRPVIMGSDRDAGAIEAARANAMRAKVEAAVSFGIHSVSAAPFPHGQRGWVVTNPPYGVRVGDTDRVRDLWSQLGKVLQDRARGWRLAVLVPDGGLERQLKIPLRTATTISNGGISVRVMIGEVP